MQATPSALVSRPLQDFHNNRCKMHPGVGNPAGSTGHHLHLSGIPATCSYSLPAVPGYVSLVLRVSVDVRGRPSVSLRPRGHRSDRRSRGQWKERECEEVREEFHVTLELAGSVP